MRKNGTSIIVVIVLLLLLALSGGAAIVLRSKQTTASQPSPAPSASPQPSITPGQTITITGTLDCLPFKNTGRIRPMACAMGLIATDGTYWALDNLQDMLVKGTVAGGDRVAVTGTTAPYEGPLQVTGIIKITTIKLSIK